MYDPPNISSLLHLLATPYNSLPSKPAIIQLGDSLTSYTYIELRDLVINFASFLLEQGVKKADVVSLALYNSVEFVVAFLAVTSLGAVVAPLNPAYTVDEFKFYMEDSKASHIVLHQEEESRFPKNAVEAAVLLNMNIHSIRVTTADSHPTAIFNGVFAQNSFTRDWNIDIKPNADDCAMFLHTSGTTSRPKGVPLTHFNLATSIKNISKTYELQAEDATLLVMPLFHVHGLMAALLSTLATRGTVALPPGGKFSASTFWSGIIQSNATWYTAVPTIHQILLMRADQDYPKENPPKLRFIRSCSASLASSILERIEMAFHAPVLEAYAMTEASHQMTSNPLPKFGPRKPGFVGPGQNVCIAILDVDNQPMPPGKEGEVCIQGDNVTKGYMNNEAANKEAFAGGWFHTGDQGFMDDDNYVKLTGRIKELINRGGEKISPLEVDEALLAHPDVAEAVSFGIPDEKYGELVAAALVLKEGKSLTEDDVKVFVASKLSNFKVPVRVFFDSVLPRTATGKIQRRIVAKYFLDKLNQL